MARIVDDDVELARFIENPADTGGDGSVVDHIDFHRTQIDVVLLRVRLGLRCLLGIVSFKAAHGRVDDMPRVNERVSGHLAETGRCAGHDDDLFVKIMCHDVILSMAGAKSQRECRQAILHARALAFQMKSEMMRPVRISPIRTGPS